MRVYLDCDGVLANFEDGCEALLGMPSRAFEQAHGTSTFWRRLAGHQDFYGTLNLLPDAQDLVEAVRHLEPIILTGLPKGGWAEPQKRSWAARHFGDIPVICCWSAAKHEHARPGDILVDDQERAGERWRAAGGRFIHHRSAEATIEQLVALGVLS